MFRLRSATVGFGLLVAVLAVMTSPAAGQTVPRSQGNFFVFATTDCTGNHSTTVTPPFTIGGRNYPPHEPLQVFATDTDTGEVVGPVTITTDANGSFCGLVESARPGHWKIDVVEPPPGSTDSKVITVLAPPTPPTTTTTTTTGPVTTTTTTTTAPGATTTTAVPGGTTTTAVPGGTTTTVGPGGTTTAPGASTTAPSTTVAPTTTTNDDFVIETVPEGPELPPTGSGTTPAVVAFGAVVLAIGLLARLTARRTSS
jgi:hypothetical protein